nr:MAG TPA: hypothetical protein [Bacteriophage sp.]
MSLNRLRYNTRIWNACVYAIATCRHQKARRGYYQIFD